MSGCGAGQTAELSTIMLVPETNRRMGWRGSSPPFPQDRVQTFPKETLRALFRMGRRSQPFSGRVL